jgi:transcriptional regulator with XRE-family HTH domain
MPARAFVTARQERLGAELRRLREQAGLSVRQVARNLSIDQTKISHIEAGRVGVSAERLRRLAGHYACDEPELVEALAAMAVERRNGWWETYREILPAAFLDLSELEHHATFLRTLEVVNIPGMFQTRDYAHAVFSFMVPQLRPEELNARVEHRMCRRTVLERENAPKFDAVVHEAALTIRVADRQVMKRQLEELLSWSERPHVTLRVIPFELDGFPAANASMLHVGGAVPLLDTFQRDTPHGSGFVTAAAEVARLTALYEKVQRLAVGPQKSRDLIHRMVRSL